MSDFRIRSTLQATIEKEWELDAETAFQICRLHDLYRQAPTSPFTQCFVDLTSEVVEAWLGDLAERRLDNPPHIKWRERAGQDCYTHLRPNAEETQ